MATKAELEAAIAQTEQQLAQAIADRDALIAQKNTLTQQKQNIEQQIANTEQAIAAKNDQIAALNQQLAALKEELANLPSEVKLGRVGVAMGHWPAKDLAERKKDIADIKAVGFTWMRTGIGWAYTEKPAGTINTNTATNIGRAMAEAKMGWLCMLGYTPLFYSTNPNNIMAAPKAEYYDEWERWVRTQVNAIVAAMKAAGYSDAEIARWLEIEIWNEQNWFYFWEKPSPTIYVQLLKRAKKVIDAINPGIKVCFGGMAPSPTRPPGPGVEKPGYRSSDFVRECYAAGMTGADFDKMNMHPYNGQQPLSATAGKPWDMNTTILNEVTQVMADNGNPRKKVDFTEFGYSTRGGANPVSEADQGKLLVAQIDYLRKRPNAGTTYVFNWRELAGAGVDENSNGYGINRHKSLGGEPKPAVAAIKAYLAKNPSPG